MVYFLGGIVVVILVAIIAYYVARFMKGKLVLELSRNAASSGEALSGRVTIEAKRAMRGLLKVSLVGSEQRREQNHGADKDSTKWVEIYRQDRILEETRDFTAGFQQDYNFEIIAPTSAEARQGGALIRKVAEEVGGGLLGSAMNMAAGAADMMQGRIYWHVEARLDVQGVDLYAKKKVTVNLRD